MSYGIVEYFGQDEEGNSCGYCKGTNTSKSHGMWAHSLTCQDYEDLMNRGWRRSGKYVYKPTMNETCCPQYTIRCDVTGFKLSKSQKKVLKKMTKYLLHNGQQSNTNKNDNKEASASHDDVKMTSFSEEVPDQPVENMKVPSDVKVISDAANFENIKGGKPCRKAKEIRLERKKKKLQEKANECGTTVDALLLEEKKKNKKCNEKLLANYIEDVPQEAKHTLKVKIVRSCPESREFKATFKEEFELYKKYQIVIHQDKADEVTEDQFRRFLVTGPLQDEKYESHNGEIPKTGLGAFHQQYYIDDHMVAVGVLDILPSCVSSKYFFYDPEYNFLSLGTYSSLREIYFVQTLQKEVEDLKYYYIGYYIDSCPKMRYKSQYTPSFLLCPETYTWHPVEQCIKKLVNNKYCRFEADKKITAEEADVNETLLLFHNKVMPFKIYFALLVEDEKDDQLKEIAEYTHLAGDCSQSLLLYRKTDIQSKLA